ncbi:hypothetical protein CoNPh17_CDS0180 [Staphylococcus phage S-CoN_Ph17]|nr:hypothetical protein CoNPh17_CDS0180 [Staphylococcus phage S-CoN_Ph17]
MLETPNVKTRAISSEAHMVTVCERSTTMYYQLIGSGKHKFNIFNM